MQLALHSHSFLNTTCAAISQAVDALLSRATPSTTSLFNSNTQAEDKNYDYHETVLLNETASAVRPAKGKIIVDGTLGGGGHAEQLLEKGATVYGIDRDPEALAYASQRLARFGDRFQTIQGNYCDAPTLLRERNIHSIDGFTLDLGVSSRQFDAATRGFSFSKEGPLDMRMGDSGQTAADIINHAHEQEIATILWKNGEERASRRIARAICARRTTTPFTTTTDLAACIESVSPRGKKKIHPATKTFQALRIAVNEELSSLEKLLEQAGELLNPTGRIAIISFHSLEDRIVKTFFRHRSAPEIDRPDWPAPRPNPDYQFHLITRKPIKATDAEIARNPRSRSAVLRVAERINH